MQGKRAYNCLCRIVKINIFAIMAEDLLIASKELGKEEFDVVDFFMSKQGEQHEVTLTKPFYIFIGFC
jgi:hypothetical protein